MKFRRNPWVLYLLSLGFVPLIWHRGIGVFEWAAYDFTGYVIVPLILALVLGFEPRELGFKLPNRRGWVMFILLFIASVPISFYGLTIPEMRNYYPIFSYSSTTGFVVKELVVGVIMFAHEAFYRGILLFPLARRNEWLAILLQDVPYTLVHIGKPSIEIPYAFAAGIIFAKMDLKGRSFLPSFLLHWFGSAFFDVLCAFF